jgi:sphinganine-1-phosphate aldolase
MPSSAPTQDAVERFRTLIALADELSHAHPYTLLAIWTLALAFAAAYRASGGRPFALAARVLFRAALRAVPASVVEREQRKLRLGIAKSVVGSSLDGERLFERLPAAGLARADVLALLDRYSARDRSHWSSGRVSGCVYHGGDALTEVMADAFARFALSNPLHPDVFPSVRKMEAEVVSMTLALFRGERALGGAGSACGVMTSGGTESILMAVKAYRDHAREHRGIGADADSGGPPELVVPVSAHAAFDKACHYFGVRLVHVPEDAATFRAVPALMAAAVTPRTIALVCSAPSYPQGVVDPVAEMAAVARERGAAVGAGGALPLHVDCCLGSFCVAFAARAGFPVSREFDFGVDGVTSISVDTHKYGFAPKGSSVLLYASEALRHSQYFVAPEWTGGIYASPSMAGSRPGALIAACWATLVSVGADGYERATRTILDAARAVAAGVRATPHVRLFGEPDLSVVCFGEAAPGTLNIYAVADAMKERGWNLNSLQNPACVHLCVTFANAARAKASFAEDLAWAVERARMSKAKGGSAAMYGLAASIPDKSLIAQVAFGFCDALYATRAPGAGGDAEVVEAGDGAGAAGAGAKAARRGSSTSRSR